MRPTGATPRFEAVVFDMDGVVTDTASLHASAWKELFDEFLATRTAPGGDRPEPLDPDGDYHRYAPELRVDVLRHLYRGQRVGVTLSPGRLRIHLHPCAAAPIRVAVGGSVSTMAAGEIHDVRITDGASTSIGDGHREPSARGTRET